MTADDVLKTEEFLDRLGSMTDDEKLSEEISGIIDKLDNLKVIGINAQESVQKGEK